MWKSSQLLLCVWKALFVDVIFFWLKNVSGQPNSLKHVIHRVLTSTRDKGSCHFSFSFVSSLRYHFPCLRLLGRPPNVEGFSFLFFLGDFLTFATPSASKLCLEKATICLTSLHHYSRVTSRWRWIYIRDIKPNPGNADQRHTLHSVRIGYLLSRVSFALWILPGNGSTKPTVFEHNSASLYDLMNSLSNKSPAQAVWRNNNGVKNSLVTRVIKASLFALEFISGSDFSYSLSWKAIFYVLPISKPVLRIFWQWAIGTVTVWPTSWCPCHQDWRSIAISRCIDMRVPIFLIMFASGLILVH